MDLLFQFSAVPAGSAVLVGSVVAADSAVPAGSAVLVGSVVAADSAVAAGSAATVAALHVLARCIDCFERPGSRLSIASPCCIANR